MDKKTLNLKLPNISISPRFGYLSPVTKRSSTERGYERFHLAKQGFSSPKCVRASHEMLFPCTKNTIQKSTTLDSPRSIILNNRRIGEKLLFDSFPSS